MASVKQPRCLINDLPEEVFERIFQLAGGELDQFGYRNIKTLLNLTTVCKSWLRPARRQLYSHITLQYGGQAVLLHSLLAHEDPCLAPLVKRFHPHDTWIEGPSTALSRMLITMSNLERLFVWARQCAALRDHPTWRQLKHLQIRKDSRPFLITTEDGQEESSIESTLHILHQKDLPDKLESLELQEYDDLAREGVDWSSLVLPHLHTFKLCHCDLIFTESSSISDNVRLLPETPRLKTFIIEMSNSDIDPEKLLTKLIKENAGTIECLKLDLIYTGRSLLSAKLLPLLPRLHTLEFIGHADANGRKRPQDVFPSSLRTLDIDWHGPLNFGTELLESLVNENEIFLPKLESVPRLVYTPVAGTALKRSAIKKLLQLAYRAQNSLLARGNVKLPALRLPTSPVESTSQIFLLPFPAGYRESLPFEQRVIMEDFEYS